MRVPERVVRWLVVGLLLRAAALGWFAIATLWSDAASRAVPPIYATHVPALGSE